MRTKVIKNTLVLLCMATSATAAEQTEAITPLNSPASAAAPSEFEKRVDFQFGGSLCAVCLNAFKGRLMSMTGVKDVEIIVDKTSPKSGHPPKVAHAVIGFDSAQISKANLIETIKRNDFQFLVARDKASARAVSDKGLSERYRDQSKDETKDDHSDEHPKEELK